MGLRHSPRKEPVRRSARENDAFGYHRILASVSATPDGQTAIDVACRLATKHHATVTAVTVIEVPPLLPLDAHMIEEEEAAHDVLNSTIAVANSYGLHLSTAILRGREAASVIVDQATVDNTELIVISATPKRRGQRRHQMFGKTVEHVLKNARCRVMIISAKPDAERSARKLSAPD